MTLILSSYNNINCNRVFNSVSKRQFAFCGNKIKPEQPKIDLKRAALQLTALVSMIAALIPKDPRKQLAIAAVGLFATVGVMAGTAFDSFKKIIHRN